jgi:hypothetical protein
MENIGQYGSSALPPYHGVMVQLCCLRCQFGIAAHPPKVRHVWGTTRAWGPHPKERGHGSFPVCSTSPPPPTRYAPWQQSLAEAPNGSRELLVYREKVLEDLDRHAVRHKRRPLRLHEAQLRQGALGEQFGQGTEGGCPMSLATAMAQAQTLERYLAKQRPDGNGGMPLALEQCSAPLAAGARARTAAICLPGELHRRALLVMIGIGVNWAKKLGSDWRREP